MNSKQNSPQPLVSILLNCFNSERYISKQLDSILAQTYANVELIVCDNHSMDRTEEIVKKYQEKDARVKWVQNESNLGMSLSFQKGLRLCTGEFIAPSDSDDFWVPEKIEMELAYLLSHPAVDLVFTDSMIVNEDLSLKLGSFQKRLGNPFCGEFISMATLLKRNLVPLHTVMFRRALVQKFLPLPEGCVHDSWIALVSSLNSPLGFINQYTVFYRQHASNDVGAWVRDLPFYLKNRDGLRFLVEYYGAKYDMMVAHQRLLGLGPNEAARKALEEKIANQEALLAIFRAATFGAFMGRLVEAARTILKSKQKYHLKQLMFLAFSWSGIRKLKLSDETTDITEFHKGYKRWGGP